MKTSFQLVAEMNEAFGNRRGNPAAPEIGRVRAQCANILHEFGELMVALGADAAQVKQLIEPFNHLGFGAFFNLDDIRDALCDIHVFAYGAHHLLGLDADRDMQEVVSKVMTRFIKDEADKQATIALHAARGVTQVYFEGDYPTMIMKSAADQPDAPRGKFLKSASFSEPKFYAPDERAMPAGLHFNEEARAILDRQNALVYGKLPELTQGEKQDD